MQALFVDNLTVIDFSYFDSERGIVGESLILDVKLFGDLNDEGMLFDFSFVKKRIKSCVDNLVDHKFLVAKKQENMSVEQTPQQLTINLETINSNIFQHVSPHQAVSFIESNSVTAESITATIHQTIKSILPENVTRIELNLRPENIDGEFYHYTHGLKKHLGDCQRIAHGHRSKIEVLEDGSYSAKWSSHIAAMWQDIYLATNEDIKEEKVVNGIDYLVFEYHANQGLFQLTIPKSRCFLIESDTTVELIAAFLVQYLKNQSPSSKFEVIAYEGVDKGAIASI